MRSSTFNSKARAPAGPWLVTWAVALGVAVLGLGALEAYWRSAGFSPSVSDTPELWAVERARVSSRWSDDSVLVLLGGSRMIQDMSRPVLEASLPGFHIVQLAIVGSAPMPALGDLARDPDFAGLVIVSLTSEAVQTSWGRTREYVDRYRRGQPLNTSINVSIASWFQERVVTRGAQLSLPSLVEAMGRGDGPYPNLSSMSRDRTRTLDFSTLPDLEHYRNARISDTRDGYAAWTDSPPSLAGFRNRLALLVEYVEAIQARGGRVALVHFPVAPEIRSIMEEFFPRDPYWDAVQATVPAIVIHYEDYPSLRDFDLPDASHLSQEDTDDFTEALLTILTLEGFFRPR